MTRLEKRLIALSNLGIRIEHEGGHRWIVSEQIDGFNFLIECRKLNVDVCKVYGGINEALDKVDTVLKCTYRKSLIHHFNVINSEFKNERKDFIVNCRSGI